MKRVFHDSVCVYGKKRKKKSASMVCRLLRQAGRKTSLYCFLLHCTVILRVYDYHSLPFSISHILLTSDKGERNEKWGVKGRSREIKRERKWDNRLTWDLQISYIRFRRSSKPAWGNECNNTNFVPISPIAPERWQVEKNEKESQ